jgi:hypothetical protein
MNNSYDEIKKLLKASNNMLKGNLTEDINRIKKSYGIISEQDSTMEKDDITQKLNPMQSAEERIEDDEPTESKRDKQQAYRISGGVLVLHGKEKNELELTTDEKIAFQETMDEFINEVSDLVDFEPLNVFKTDVEWGGKIIDFDIEFYFSIGENNGIYVNGSMVKIDDNFLEVVNKLKSYYEKFKAKWAKVLANRKKTSTKKQTEQ